MFCSNCGTEAIKGAAFCQKCGAKLAQENSGEQEHVPATRTALKPGKPPVVGEELVHGSKPISVSVSEPIETLADRTDSIRETVQGVDIQEEAPTISGSAANYYQLLKENAHLCLAIKSIKQLKKSIRLCGRICNHSVRLVSGHIVQTRLRSVLAFPFSILYGLLAGVFFATAWIIIADLVKYGSIYREYYHGILLALLCLVGGVIVFIHTFVGRKEKDDIEKYVRGISESRQIYLSERKWVGASTIKIVAAAVLIVAGVIILPLSLPEPLEYPDELLFDGFPVTRFLDMTQKDLESEFGEAEWIGQNMTTSDDYYNYDEGIKHVIYSKETGKVIYIQFGAICCTCNRKKLDKSLDRVVDILSDRYRGYSSYGVYGSIHNGFYYDGVYFGEAFGTEEYLAQQRFEDGRNMYYSFMPLTVLGEEYYDASWSLVGREKQDYNIDLIINVAKNNEDLTGVYDICLYTDEWVEMVNATSENSDAVNVEFFYDDISVSELIGFSAVEIVQKFGGGYTADGNGQIWYHDIDFDMRDDETVDRIWIFDCEKCSINGELLKVNSDGVIDSETVMDLLGQDYEDEWMDIGYFMTYCYPLYTLSFEINKYNAVCSIMVRNLAVTESVSGLDAGGSMAGQEPIESYYVLAGKYDSTGQSTLSLSIFSSQSEGERAIGNIWIYLQNGKSYEGEVFPLEKNGYQVVTDTGEDIMLAVSEDGDDIVLQLYVDGQYMEEFWMTEHFWS